MYVIPRDKMKKITYGQSNEGAGLSTHVQLVWTIGHAQNLQSKAEADDRSFKC